MATELLSLGKQGASGGQGNPQPIPHCSARGFSARPARFQRESAPAAAPPPRDGSGPCFARGFVRPHTSLVSGVSARCHLPPLPCHMETPCLSFRTRGPGSAVTPGAAGAWPSANTRVSARQQRDKPARQVCLAWVALGNTVLILTVKAGSTPGCSLWERAQSSPRLVTGMSWSAGSLVGGSLPQLLPSTWGAQHPQQETCTLSSAREGAEDPQLPLQCSPPVPSLSSGAGPSSNGSLSPYGAPHSAACPPRQECPA